MSTSSNSSLVFASYEVTIYMGIPILVGGVIGDILNTIIFLSLQTYRQSSCAFYLLVASIFDLGQLLTGLLTRIMIGGFDIDWTQNSVFYCKFRAYTIHICALISLTSNCLATIDQFLATSTRPRWQRWSNIKQAHYLSLGVILFWLLYGIPQWILTELIESPSTGKLTCVNRNLIYQIYASNFYAPVILGALPLSITIGFGLLAYCNVRQLAYRTVPLVRRQHDQQLTGMVLVQVIFNFFALSPYVILVTITSHTNYASDPVIGPRIQFATSLSICFYYLYHASPFFIYVGVSERFRRQLRYVLIDIHLNQWWKPRNRVSTEAQQVSANNALSIPLENIFIVS